MRPEDNERLRKLAEERSKRDREALRCYRPLPSQVVIHKSKASERVVRGGNRCLGGEQEIYDPVLNISRRIDSIDREFHVVAYDSGEEVVSKSCRPFIKGYGELYRVHLSNGQSIVATKQHRLLTVSGWASVSDCLLESLPILPASTSGTCLSVSPLDAHDSIRTVQDSQCGYRRERHSCDERLRQAVDTCLDNTPSQVDAREHNRRCLPSGVPADELEHSRFYRESARLSMKRASTPVLQSFASESRSFSQPYSRPFAFAQAGQQFPEVSCRPFRTTHASAQSASQFALEGEASFQTEECDTALFRLNTQHASQLQYIQALRQNTSAQSRHDSHSLESPYSHCGSLVETDGCVTIIRLEYLRQGDIWDITVEDYSNYVCGGVINSNSGKSVSCAAEFASAALRMPIIGVDGKPLPLNYPTNRPLLMWCVGFDQRHIGQTMHRLLFEPGLFQVIRDEVTDEWRMWKPWDEADQKRASEAVPAEPMIPQREVKSIAWEGAAQRIFDSVTLVNGTKICAYPSTGEPKQGDPVDVIWIDEDIRWSRHVGEWQARLSDRKGRLLWSAFPHSTNNALIRMCERAHEQQSRANPDVEEILLRYRDNPFIDADEKRKRLEGWSEVEARARDMGEFTHDEVLMYDWTPAVSGVPNDRGDKCPINRCWEKKGRFPDSWTRYVFLDPGHTTTCALFFAVPNPEGAPEDAQNEQWGDCIVLEDEVYLHRCGPLDTAKACAEKMMGRQYEAFVIDMHAGRMTTIGAVKTVKELYAEAFAKHGLKCRQSGSWFSDGSDNLAARREMLRLLLSQRETGDSKLRVVLDRAINFQKEIKSFRKRVTGDEFVNDEPNLKMAHDAIDAAEYMSAYMPSYVPMEQYQGLVSNLYQQAMKMFSKKSPETKKFYFGPGEAA